MTEISEITSEAEARVSVSDKLPPNNSKTNSVPISGDELVEYQINKISANTPSSREGNNPVYDL